MKDSKGQLTKATLNWGATKHIVTTKNDLYEVPFVFANNAIENISVLTTNNIAIPSYALIVQKAKDGTTSARIKMTLEENETITNAFKAKKFKHLYVFNDLNGSKKAAFVWVNATDTKPTQVYWKTEIGGTTTNSAFSSNNQPTNSNNNVGVLTNNPSVSNGFGPEFPSSIYDQFDKAHDYFLINGNSELNASEKAMSYVLEKNNTGVVLLKQDSNGDFKRLQTNESTVNGITTYTTNNCP